MDDILANKMGRELIGKTLEGWTIQRFIDKGKSAAVFEAIDAEGKPVAIKFLDNDIVQRFGKDKQFARIEREKELIGAYHKNLVKIFGGGEWPEKDLLYVVMEYISSKNLLKANSRITIDHVCSIIEQIALACEFLEGYGLAHRDIKTENVVISDDLSKIVVLDLGVVHPFGLAEDYEENKDFVATLRYSPPELLLRVEDDNKEAWRAITFYQIGAVIYELVTKKLLFADHSDPYARLVNAVQNVIPQIKVACPPVLRNLALMCLHKDYKKRLSHLSWDNFKNIEKTHISRDDVRSALSLRGASSAKKNQYHHARLLKNFVDDLETMLKAICVSDKTCFPSHDTKVLDGVPLYRHELVLQFSGFPEVMCFRTELISPDEGVVAVYCNGTLLFQDKTCSGALREELEEVILNHIYQYALEGQHE
jgi:serine/threonine protein kinase